MSVDPTPLVERAIPRAVRQIGGALAARGKRTWAVGGSIRDLVRSAIRGTPVPRGGDWDLATDATPEEVIATFRKVIPTGLKHGTVTVLIERERFEVTTLRGEKGYSDGRHPDEVFFTSDLELDLARRDFTVNAIAFDLATNRLEDPFDGRGDLERGLIRAVGDPATRFGEDGLRVLRAARFAATLEMRVEEATERAMGESLDSYRKVSFERVKDEWWKALRAREPSRFLRLARSSGLLSASFPELFPASGDEFRTLLELADATSPDPLRRLALVFSLGLPESERAETARLLLERLRTSHLERDRVLLFLDAERLPESLDEPDLRRYLARLGRDEAESALSFLTARYPTELPELGGTHAFLTVARRQLSGGGALSLGELAVRGNDLVQAGIPPGKAIGETLAHLLDAVLVDPANNERQRLLALATAFGRARGG